MSVAFGRFVRSSLPLWMAVACFGAYFLVHIRHYVNFGIDLVGGTYVALELDANKLLESELHDATARVVRSLKSEGVHEPVQRNREEGALTLVFANEQEAQTYAAALQSRFDRLHITGTRTGASVKCSFAGSAHQQIVKQAVENNISVLGVRLDKFGVGEVQVAAHGDRQVFVELPQVQDSAQARAIIGKSALLEIKPVLDVGRTEQELKQRAGGKIPDSQMIVPVARAQGATPDEFCLVPRYAEITGKHLKSARANPMGGQYQLDPVVEFSLDAEGAQRFYKMTSMPNARISMILDGVAITVATAKSPIPDGSVVLSGRDFTIQSVQDLAKLLSSGVFAAPMNIVADRTIGPSMGAEAIRQGLFACAVGLIALFIFALWFYRLPGILAFIVLLFNLLLILFILAMLGATLTLPGIYGMVLTLGMAIDASVLIYERIREELARGIHLDVAVETGFSGALAVILDANLTTLIAALALYYFGSGPIQGFAVTMAIGILSTLITGFLLLRALLRFVVFGLGVRTLRF